MDLSSLFLVLILILTVIYWYLTGTFDYWKKQNVPSVPNPIPGFGHMLPVISIKENITTFASNIYKNFNSSVVGFYFLRKPGIVVRDPELVKTVMNTHFSSFRNNGIILNSKSDPVLALNPFFVTDDIWKESRARAIRHLSSKNLKQLFAFVREVSSEMSEFISKKIEENGDSLECEFKEFFTKYTGEFVANAAFAIHGQSFKDKPDNLSFVKVAKTIFEPTIINGIKQSLVFFLPDVSKLFRISFLPKRVDNYFRENLKIIIADRKKTNVVHSDFLQLCLESNSNEDINSIVADILIFFVDSYETSSTALASLFYYLSRNKEIQDKLRTHIITTIESTGGELTYESLKNMNYLDQVIHESLRLLPPLGAFMKVCTEEITITGSDGIKCRLEPGHMVIIPVMALHNDSNHWIKPQVFDPDRFTPENQAKRNKYVHLPFGDGPRMCLGMRLGLMLLKAATVSLLSKYSIEISLKTKMPLEVETTSIITYIQGGLWGKFKKLSQ